MKKTFLVLPPLIGMPLGKDNMFVCVVLRARKFSLSIGMNGESVISDLVSSTCPAGTEME